MEANELSDIEFRVMIIRMLQEFQPRWRHR